MSQGVLYDAVVLGAGAAGLMCALTAGQRGKRVLLIEHTDAPGKKIRISGGGRCNFTNLHTAPSCFISRNPRFCHSALARYTPADFVGYVEGHGIVYHEKKLGQLFCDGSAQQIIDALIGDCGAAGVELRLGCTVTAIERGDHFILHTEQGAVHAGALVVATGGLSIPKLGATDFGYRIARQFGLSVVPCAPALVPLTMASHERGAWPDLSGLSFEAVVATGHARFQENVLVTHKGFSGPAILQISSYWEKGQSIDINLLPDRVAGDALKHLKRTSPGERPEKWLASQMPARLAHRLCEAEGWTRALGQMADADVTTMGDTLHKWPIMPNGTEGYTKAEVTRGGVDTKAINPRTMEAKDVQGLYFVGEVLDVTGWLGGYNFQWAWSSSVAAGEAL